MSEAFSSYGGNSYNSHNAVMYVVVSSREAALLPPDALIIRCPEDAAKLPADLRGKTVYTVGEIDYTRRPAS